jgi:hypothetical protein
MTVYFNANDEPTWIPDEPDPVWDTVHYASRTPGDAEEATDDE